MSTIFSGSLRCPSGCLCLRGFVVLLQLFLSTLRCAALRGQCQHPVLAARACSTRGQQSGGKAATFTALPSCDIQFRGAVKTNRAADEDCAKILRDFHTDIYWMINQPDIVVMH
ncbi:hypothetical protein Q8A73_017601 [Channa argus]|nr:hypothetical protein Q8A73_017601 [Channa argus]